MRAAAWVSASPARRQVADIDDDCQPAEAGKHLAQKFDPLAGKIARQDRQASNVAPRPRESRDQTAPNRVGRHREHDWDRRSCLLCGGTALPTVRMVATLSRTNSAANSTNRSLRPSAQRYSIATVWPSIHPSSRSRCTKAAVQSLQFEGVLAPRKPIVSSFACCARAASGHATEAPAKKGDKFAPLHAPSLTQGNFRPTQTNTLEGFNRSFGQSV